jgi:diketogulonate reductase-like aldo/keto reductase
LANAETWNTPIPLNDPIILEVAKNHGISAAQVLLRFLVQRGIVVLPKSMKPERMAQNLDILDFSLTEEEMGKIKTLDKYVRTNPNPLSAFIGGPDAFTAEGTDIFD